MGTWVWSLGWGDPLEKGMATHSSIFDQRIPWTEKPGRLQSMGTQRVRHGWVTNTHSLMSFGNCVYLVTTPLVNVWNASITLHFCSCTLKAVLPLTSPPQDHWSALCRAAFCSSLWAVCSLSLLFGYFSAFLEMGYVVLCVWLLFFRFPSFKTHPCCCTSKCSTNCYCWVASCSISQFVGKYPIDIPQFAYLLTHW